MPGPTRAVGCDSDLLLCWRFKALQHFSGNFGCGQLTYPHCSWASLLGSLPVLCAHSFASNRQLPFLNQWKGENGCRNHLTKLHKRMLPDVRIEPATVCIPGRRRSDRATAPGRIRFVISSWTDSIKPSLIHSYLVWFPSFQRIPLSSLQLVLSDHLKTSPRTSSYCRWYFLVLWDQWAHFQLFRIYSTPEKSASGCDQFVLLTTAVHEQTQ